MSDIEEKAFVVDVDEEFVFLTRDNISCSSCSSNGGCGSLASVFSFKTNNRLKLENTLGLKKGDTVVISVSSLSILLSAFLVYLFPLFSLFLFSFFAKILVGETFSILVGLVGFFLGFLLSSRLLKKKLFFNQLQPQLIRKVINVHLM